eukprot:19075-Heterococcus_DN1.PRE.1
MSAAAATAATTVSPTAAATATADISADGSTNSDAPAAGGDVVGSIVSTNTGSSNAYGSSSGDNRSVLHGSSSTASDTAAYDGAATITTDSSIKLVPPSSSSSSDSSFNSDSTNSSSNISSSISELDSVVLSGMQAAQLTMNDTTVLQQHGITMVASHELLEGQVIAKVLGALKASLGSASRSIPRIQSTISKLYKFLLVVAAVESVFAQLCKQCTTSSRLNACMRRCSCSNCYIALCLQRLAVTAYVLNCIAGTGNHA